jgi:hypothetical protein
MRRALRLVPLALSLCVGQAGCFRSPTEQAPEAPAVVHVAPEPARSAKPAEALPRRVARCGEGTEARPVDFYLDEMRAFMNDPAADSNSSAAKALALLGDPRAIDFLRDQVAKSADPFSLAALVLLDDENARQRALSMLAGLDESDFTMIAYGFERRPDPVVVRRAKVIATTGTTAVEIRFAQALLASMGVDFQKETLAVMAQGADSRDAVFAARSLMKTHASQALPILEAVLQNPKSDSFDLAGSAFGAFPEYAKLDLLLGAHGAAESPYDKIWLDYAIVAKCRRG